MKAKYLSNLFFISLFLTACSDYLDVAPDNIATIDNAFTLRSQAEKYLFTCYAYMPHEGYLTESPSYMMGTELNKGNDQHYSITQNINSPYLDYWSCFNRASLWRGIRDCNIFLENVDKVPDLDYTDKLRWISEVQFLKAYYHFYLLRLYGPVPVIDKNQPINAKTEEVRVFRQPVDKVFDYIVDLMDTAITHLPDAIIDENAELGRITKPIALAVKAKILTYAASPFYNGNTDYKSFTNKDGTVLFPQEYDPQKWKIAAEAAKKAIDACEALGYKLYYFEETNQTGQLPDILRSEMNYRTAFTERWNSEIIWGLVNCRSSVTDYQRQAYPRWLDPATLNNTNGKGALTASYNYAELFYSDHGVPIEEDVTYDYDGRFNLKVATEDDRFQIKEGYATAKFNFNREPRFYASIAGDGFIWYGQGHYKLNDLLYVQGKQGQIASAVNVNGQSTGYYIPKFVYYTNVLSTTSDTYVQQNYPWPLFRLSELYLLYAEALNEAEGPTEDVQKYVNLVRERSGLPAVSEAWTTYSKRPDKFKSREGMRTIIQQERQIELCLEGQQFYDLVRWKKALSYYNKPFYGWDVRQETVENYNRLRVMRSVNFQHKHYLWPIKEYDLIINPNLVQNPGW